MMQIEFWIITILLGGTSFDAHIECQGPKPLTEKNAICSVSVPPKCIQLQKDSLDCALYAIPQNCEGFKFVKVKSVSSAVSFVPKFGCAHKKGSFSEPPIWVYNQAPSGKNISVEWSR